MNSSCHGLLFPTGFIACGDDNGRPSHCQANQKSNAYSNRDRSRYITFTIYLWQTGRDLRRTRSKFARCIQVGRNILRPKWRERPKSRKEKKKRGRGFILLDSSCPLLRGCRAVGKRRGHTPRNVSDAITRPSLPSLEERRAEERRLSCSHATRIYDESTHLAVAEHPTAAAAAAVRSNSSRPLSIEVCFETCWFAGWAIQTVFISFSCLFSITSWFSGIVSLSCRDCERNPLLLCPYVLLLYSSPPPFLSLFSIWDGCSNSFFSFFPSDIYNKHKYMTLLLLSSAVLVDLFRPLEPFRRRCTVRDRMAPFSLLNMAASGVTSRVLVSFLYIYTRYNAPLYAALYSFLSLLLLQPFSSLPDFYNIQSDYSHT